MVYYLETRKPSQRARKPAKCNEKIRSHSCVILVTFAVKEEEKKVQDLKKKPIPCSRKPAECREREVLSML